MSTQENINVTITDITGINGAGLNAALLATCTNPFDGANKAYVDSLFPITITNIGLGAQFYSNLVTGISGIRSLPTTLSTPSNNPTNLYFSTNMFYNPYPWKKGDSTSVSFANSSIGGSYDSSALAPNGKIYSPPLLQTSVLIIDPVSLTLDTTSLPYNYVGGNKFSSSSLAPNGKIYCVPMQDTNILIIDPIANTLDTTSISIPGLSNAVNKWHSSVVTPSGILYGIPRDDTRVLIINTNNNTYDLTSLGVGGLGVANKYTSCCLAPNGKIYCPPYTGALSYLIIDTLARTATIGTIIPPITVSMQSATLAPNGKIYSFPFSGLSAIVVLNPLNNTLDSSTIKLNTAGNFNYAGSVLAADGLIYSFPVVLTTVAIVNPNANVADTTSIASPGNFTHGTFAPNGKIFSAPWQNSNMLIISTGPPVINMRQCL